MRKTVTVELYLSRLMGIVDEVAGTLVRTAFSYVLRDMNDYACGLFDTRHNMIALASHGTPGLYGSMSNVVRNFCREIPPERLEPGDVLVTNDPWIATGHLNDITLATPVFAENRLVGFSVCVAHHLDIGGRLATIDSRENYEEGLRLPIAKLYRAGTPSEELFNIIRANVRVPDKVIGDLRAQVAALHVGAARLGVLATEIGADAFAELAADVVDRTEKSLRETIKTIPEGVYRHEAEIFRFRGRSLRISVAVHVRGDEVHIDYAGTTPQIEAAINATLSYASSYTTFAIKCALNKELPINEGTFRPVTVRAPEASILNAKYPIAVWGRTTTGQFVPELIFQALGKVIPERLLAGSGSCPEWLGTFSDRENGVHGIFNLQGGLGARPMKDGVSCLPFPANPSSIPVEVLEAESPFLVERRALVADSAGAGSYRGGFGQELVLRVRATRGGGPRRVTFSMRGGRFHRGAPGLNGGKPGSLGRLTVNGRPIQWGKQYFLGVGDLVRIEVPGGGGYGLPASRDPALTEEDVRNGLVTPPVARASRRRTDASRKPPGTGRMVRKPRAERRALSTR